MRGERSGDVYAPVPLGTLTPLTLRRYATLSLALPPALAHSASGARDTQRLHRLRMVGDASAGQMVTGASRPRRSLIGAGLARHALLQLDPLHRLVPVDVRVP